MLRTITIAGVLACASMLGGCAGDTTTLDTTAQGPPAEATSATPQSFQVQLRGDTTAESVIPQIVAAAHDQLAVACEAAPGATIRIVNPLASGESADIPCSSILDGDGRTSTSSGVQRDGAIGEARQRLTPLGPLLCGLTTLGISFVASTACGDVKATEQGLCRVSMLGSDVGWLFVCSLMF